MENRIEQEVNKTLECMGGDFEILVSPVFTENLNRRMSDVRISRGVGFRSRSFYPVMIAVVLVLNLAIGLTTFTGNKYNEDNADNQLSSLASEYGIGSNSYSAF